MKERIRLFCGFAILLGALVAFSCVSPVLSNQTASLVLMIAIPPSVRADIATPPARLIVPGTADFLITITDPSGGDPIVRSLNAPTSGSSASIEITGLPTGGTRNVSVVSRDAAGGQISTGSASTTIVEGSNSVMITLSNLTVDASDLIIPSAPFTHRTETLALGEVKILTFTPPTEASDWPEYSISAMYTPCSVTIYNSSLQPVTLVNGTAEKWALVTESAAHDPFFIVLANTTGRNNVSVELRLERAVYSDRREGTNGSGARTSPLNFSFGTLLGEPATALPIRFILAATGSNPYGSTSLYTDGESLYGGFGGVAGNWTRNFTTWPTVIQSAFTGGSTYSTLTAGSGISRATVVDGCAITANDYSSSYGTTILSLISISGGASPIITNNKIIGPAPQCGMSQSFVQYLYGMNMDGTSASAGPIIAFNDIVGAKLNEPNGEPDFDMDAHFQGIHIANYPSANAAPRLISNDIVSWLGIEEPYDNGDAVLYINGYGVQLFNSGILLNNTINSGRKFGTWTMEVYSDLAFHLFESGNPTIIRNNAIGSTEAPYSLAPNQTVIFYDSGDMTINSVISNFLYRAIGSYNLTYLYPGTPTNETALLPASLSSNYGPAAGAVNALNAFVDPLGSSNGYFGNRRLTGSGTNSTANPAASGAELTSASSITSVLSVFEQDFLRWDRDGNARTSPWSIGAYEKD